MRFFTLQKKYKCYNKTQLVEGGRAMLENLPVLLLKKLVLLPYQEVRLELNVELSKKVIDQAENFTNNKLLIICPNDTLETSPSASDLPNIGVLSKIKSKIELPNGNYRVVICGLNRVIVKNYKNNSEDREILESLVKRIYVDDTDQASQTAVIRTLKSVVGKYMEINPAASNSVTNTIANMTDLDMLTDIITNYMPFDLKKKVSYMNEFDALVRANNLIKDINLELEVINIETKIDDEIREQFEKEQRDFILKQKINKLNEELGLNLDKQSEVSFFNKKIEQLEVNEKTRKKLFDEVKKYSYTSETNPDSSVIRNYLDTVISLPWNIYSKDETNIKKIKKSLDKSHYGLEEAKQRVLEYIAVKKNSNNIKAPIICLVGPPGTGKTTLGISISKALNKEFFKISVGGLNDSTELTGHKRTYLGSSPGKIIQGIKKCNTSNPLILIDEVDKMIKDFKGDPSAVLLDILDPSQNNQFTDNYIEEPFDLSKVMFILTANDIKTIPAALKDRLEIIEISSYTETEKIDIAKNYLIPNIVEEYNVNKIKIADELLLFMITSYTKEPGIRELDRVLRKIYRNIIINEIKAKQLDMDTALTILGPPKYDTTYIRRNHIGSVSTMGVTPYGGVVINIESTLTPGEGKINITGNVEDSIKESINIGYSFIKSKTKEFGIDTKQLKNNDININALNYGIKKDGTSGGLAFTTSIVSLLLGKEVSNNITFTGEITLHGDILKVGGIKEKIIGAYNNGYKKIFIPLENKNDLIKVPDNIKNTVEIIQVSDYQEVFNELFKKHK